MSTDPLQETQIHQVNARLTAIPLVEGYACLEEIVVRQNHIDHLDEFPESVCNTLERLDLYLNKLDSINVAVNSLRNLVFLDLSFNGIRTIENLGNLQKLRELYLINNKLKRIQGVDSLHSLRILELGSNRIRKIDPIKDVPNLESLFLGRNKIEKIENLETLTSIQRLDLQSNRITNIGDGLSHLVNLRELYLSHNAIESTQGLGSLIMLQTLDIGSNQIRKLEGLQALTNLEEFWLSSNLLEDMDEVLAALANHPVLQTVYLEGNPVSTISDYFDRVTTALPTLIQLDAIQTPGGLRKNRFYQRTT